MVSPVVPQKGLANLRRIESLPWLLAAAVAALAVGAMVHTLSSGIRNAAPQLATLARARSGSRDVSCAAACAGARSSSPSAPPRSASRSG